MTNNINAQTSSSQSAATGDSDPPRQPTDQATGRETKPSIEEIADRVYRLFYEEIRRERERRGRWR